MARTRDGHELPVIDVTDPRFAVPDDSVATRALYDAFIDGERRRHRIPKFIMRMMLRRAARKSLIVRALFNSDAGYLDGMTTYLMKLGADQMVPPYDSEIDRRLAASPHVTLLRLRMQQIARLLADGLVEHLAGAAGAPLHLINIGGGPALDSVNALVLLCRDHADLMRRPVVVHVLRLEPGWTVVRRERARAPCGRTTPAARARRPGSATTTTGTPRPHWRLRADLAAPAA